ncbi:MAG: TIGR02300 family protein [Rhodospirillales bacterium]|nr:TIGR02300 family protein [Rhodospirillales bacterium]
MAQAAWGTKRRCQSCGAHFYDLNKDPIVCPKCHATYQHGLVRKRFTPATPLRPRPRHAEAEEVEHEEVEHEEALETEEAAAEEEAPWQEEEGEERQERNY